MEKLLVQTPAVSALLQVPLHRSIPPCRAGNTLLLLTVPRSESAGVCRVAWAPLCLGEQPHGFQSSYHLGWPPPRAVLVLFKGLC